MNFLERLNAKVKNIAEQERLRDAVRGTGGTLSADQVALLSPDQQKALRRTAYNAGMRGIDSKTLASNYQAQQLNQVSQNLMAQINNSQLPEATKQGLRGMAMLGQFDKVVSALNPTLTKPSGKLLQVVNQDGVYQRNITVEDFMKNGLKPNEKLTNLPTGTAPAPSKSSDGFDGFKTQYLATNKIIKATSSLARQFKDDETSALRVGTTAQFVDSVIQNIDKGLNLMSGKEDRKLYKAAQTNRSEEGTDFGQRIKDVSINTGVAESQIRDLAYLFAEARGQTGRGLSDKDYENALRIVSGGVGAEGRSAVLGDVSNRISEEFRDKLELEKIYANEDYLEKLNKLPDLETFVNPYESSSSTIDELLRKY